MKRLNWLKTICITSASLTSVAPIVLTTTSCTTDKLSLEYYTFDNLKNAYNNNKQNPGDGFAGQSKMSIKYQDLVIGNKKINSGNYIMLIGTNSQSTTCEFFSGSAQIRESSKWYDSTIFTSSMLYKIFETQGKEGDSLTIEQINKLIPFTFVNVIDYSPKKFYDNKGHSLYLSKDGETPDVSYVDPFKQWDDDLISKTYHFNAIKRKIDGGTFEWDKDSVKAKTYIRNDAEAIAFRNFNILGSKIYPKDDKGKQKDVVLQPFNTSADADSSRIAVFKDGVLKKLDYLPKTTETLVKLIVDNFTKDEKKDS